MRGLSPLPAVGLLLVATLAASLAAADTVRVRAWPHDGFGRVVFDWPRRVDYEVARDGRSLTVGFSRTIDADLTPVLARLPDYVTAASVDDGGRRVVLSLSQPFGVHSFRYGDSVAVDLIEAGQPYRPPDSAGRPVAAVTPEIAPGPEAAPTPPSPQALPAPATEAGSAPVVDVRLESGPGLSRVVFDWPTPVGYALERNRNRAVIVFDRRARIDVTALPATLPAPIGSISAETTADGLRVAIAVPADVDLRSGFDGPRVVLDVLAPGAAADATAGPPPAPSAGDTPAEAAGSGPDAAPRSPTGETGAGGATAGSPADRPPASGTAAASAPAEAPAPEAPAGEAVPTLPAGTRLLPDSITLAAAEAAEAAAPAVPGALPVDVTRDEETVSLRFDWTDPVAAAVFRLGEHLWIAFDGTETLDLSALSRLDRRIVGAAEQIETEEGTVLRLPLVPGVNGNVWRDGEAWIVDLRPQQQRPEVALVTEVQTASPQGPRLFFPVEGAGRSVRVRDPEVGDEYLIVPLVPLGRGIDGERRYAELDLLGSTQGIPVRVRADGIGVRYLPDGVAIVREGGLYLSDAKPKARLGEDGGTEVAVDRSRLFDVAAWKRGDGSSFLEEKQALQLMVASSTSLSRAEPRLALAQFYFANGYAPEALGLLRTIAEEDPELANEPSVRALRGAASFLMRRFEAAREDLLDPALTGIPEAELWRGATAAALQRWREAAEHFARAGEIPVAYPRHYKTEIALLAAESAIRVGDLRGAAQFLDEVLTADPTPSELARVEYYRGRVLYDSGDRERGLAIWQALADGPDRWAMVRARLALIEDGLENGTMTRQEAIEELENLRYAWRGDEIEFAMLRKLGRLYLEEGNYREGLGVLKQAATYFPNDPAAKDVGKEMLDAFERLYLDGLSERMPPLQALSLYEDFRELTPVGRKGNEMIEKLADRLVSVELLDRAATLLEHQVKFRLKGQDRARVGARLAVIRLLDRKPDLAIQALDESRATTVPRDLEEERERLRARALYELDQTDEALRLIAGDRGREADQLRAEIYMQTQQWAEAAEAFADLIGGPPIAGRPLEPQQSGYVLNRAVALALAGDSNGLTRLRSAFVDAMDKGPYKEPFRLITNQTDGDLSNFDTLVDRFREIDRLQSFMSNYQDLVSQGRLSAMN